MAVIATAVAGTISWGWRASAATITAEYAEGHRNVIINGYGVDGLGTFRLTDGDTTLLALCLEAHVRHTVSADAYAPAANTVVSEELDVLLWRAARHTPLDADTASAVAALTWYYARAERNGGGPVWANIADGWAAITPLRPNAWDAPLPTFSTGFPVGLRSLAHGDLDAAVANVAALHRGVQPLRG